MYIRRRTAKQYRDIGVDEKYQVQSWVRTTRHRPVVDASTDCATSSVLLVLETTFEIDEKRAIFEFRYCELGSCHRGEEQGRQI